LHRDCHLKFDTSLYSAPFTLVGQRLWIKVSDCSVAIFHHYQHLHTHPRAQRRGERITVRDHLPPDAAAFLAHDREYCLKQASAVGPACAAFISALFGDAILERLRSAQNVLRLEQTYGPARLEAACARALAFDTLQYRWVKNILVGGHDHLSLPSLAPAQAYAAAARFTRNAQDLFTAQPGRLQ
jgi:hypothetical protein